MFAPSISSWRLVVVNDSYKSVVKQTNRQTVIVKKYKQIELDTPTTHAQEATGKKKKLLRVEERGNVNCAWMKF